MTTVPRTRSAVSLLAALCASGCMVGPDYHRPTTAVAPAFKEQGWTPAQPADAAPRGDWWVLFNDPVLNALASKVAVSNQNVAAAEAAYRQARALVSEQRAALFPTVDLTGGGTRSGAGRNSSGAAVTTGTGSTVATGGRTTTTYRASLGASWEPDVWGRIRRTIQNAKANAQASAADLAAATLSAQGELSVDYFNLRSDDAQIAVLTVTVDGYQRSLKIAQNRYDAGIAPHSDLLQARSQLASTQADLADLGRDRAVLEHAVAVLVGQTPESFDLAADPNWIATVPGVPAGVPSTLLQRRPDIAAAERRADAANATIGIETAAYFPALTLSGSYGFAATELGHLFEASNSVWSYGLSAAETLFDAGARHARVRGARAGYDAAVANYRQTVLAAFQDVENQLVASRVQAQEYDLRKQAADDADLAAGMVLNQYKAGQVAYTDVVTAQATATSARRTLVQTAAIRQATAVALIQGIGGGWVSQY